jgi:type I restriction enzyme S subunit
MPLLLPFRIAEHQCIDAFIARRDRLEAALTTTDTTRIRLLEALLHEALEPASDRLEAAE